MSMFGDKTMELIERSLKLKAEYLEDLELQHGRYPRVKNKYFQSNRDLQTDENDLSPALSPIEEDWCRLYLALYAILKKHPELTKEIPSFEDD